MPEPLKRPKSVGAYGWSYIWSKEQRAPSEEYKKNYDLIDWSKGPKFTDRPPDKIVNGLRGRAKVWIYPKNLTEK